MIIDHKHKFIFIHIPKCAGTSVVDTLVEHLYNTTMYCRSKLNEDLTQIFYVKVPHEAYVPGNSNDIRKHTPLNEVKEYLTNKGIDINDYFTFSIARNPWARTVSQYTYARQIIRKRATESKMSYQWAKKFGSGTLTDCINTTSFFPTQCEMIGTGVDFLSDGYNLQKDFDTICDRIGISHIKLKHMNQSASKDKYYIEYYDDEARELVAKKYADDIKLFDYEFGK
jgi:hypothetical protein